MGPSIQMNSNLNYPIGKIINQELQAIENQNPIKLHQLGAEIASPSRVATIHDNGDMLPLFGIVPWKHHVKLLEAQLEQNVG